jgi:hypothetical protein
MKMTLKVKFCSFLKSEFFHFLSWDVFHLRQTENLIWVFRNFNIARGHSELPPSSVLYYLLLRYHSSLTTLPMGAARCIETLVTNYQPTWCHILEDCNVHQQCHVNLRSLTFYWLAIWQYFEYYHMLVSIRHVMPFQYACESHVEKITVVFTSVGNCLLLWEWHCSMCWDNGLLVKCKSYTHWCILKQANHQTEWWACCYTN